MQFDEHMMAATTAEDLIDATADALAGAELYFGHGTDNPDDEAAALVFHVLELDHFGDASQYKVIATPEQKESLLGLLRTRIETRQPLPYLLGEAWFGGLSFQVDERVLVPRSPIAELIADQFVPWVEPDRIKRILDVGTGSGCIAIACALAFPEAEVTASDISPDALALAAINVQRHQVQERLVLVEADLLDGLKGPFDLIVSNPPYVPSTEMAKLPDEYRHEPSLGLVSGNDGLDSARRILQDAPGLLSPQGVLILEVGAQWEELERAFPQLPFTWLDFAQGGIGVAVLHAADFRAG